MKSQISLFVLLQSSIPLHSSINVQTLPSTNLFLCLHRPLILLYFYPTYFSSLRVFTLSIHFYPKPYYLNRLLSPKILQNQLLPTKSFSSSSLLHSSLLLHYCPHIIFSYLISLPLNIALFRIEIHHNQLQFLIS